MFEWGGAPLLSRASSPARVLQQSWFLGSRFSFRLLPDSLTSGAWDGPWMSAVACQPGPQAADEERPRCTQARLNAALRQVLEGNSRGTCQIPLVFSRCAYDVSSPPRIEPRHQQSTQYLTMPRILLSIPHSKPPSNPNTVSTRYLSCVPRLLGSRCSPSRRRGCRPRQPAGNPPPA